MTVHLFRKAYGGLKPDTEEANVWLSGVGEGEAVMVDCKDPRRRSNRQHAYWFVMLHLVWDNSDAIRKMCGNFDTFRKRVEIELGYFTEVASRDGAVDRIPHSVAFHKMEQADFSKLVDKTLDFFEGIGFDRGALRAETSARVAEPGAAE